MDSAIAKGKIRNQKRRDALVVLSFLMPNLIGFLVFTLIPVFATAFLSFTKWDLLGEIQLVGLDNYARLLSSKRFGQAMANTLYYTVGTVSLSIFLALCLSVLMNRKIRGIYLYRTIYYLPVVSSGVAIALLWKFIYADNVGLLATVFRMLGLESPKWITSTRWSMTSIIIMSIWKGLGGIIVLLLAGLQGISPSYYEAARIDGANGRQQFFRITVPMITPTLFFQVVMSIIGSFQVFEQTAILTEGGPGFSSTSIVYYIYTAGFQDLKFGYACAMSMILFLIILVVTVLQWIGQRKWVTYDAY